jgi:hypothetical protein
VVITGIAIAGFIYLCLPKIEVKLARGGFYRQMQTKQIILHFEFIDGDWHTVSEARAGLKELVSNPTNTAPSGLKDWDNDLVGGQVREEDSPGNYMLRATNSQLQLITFDRDGAEEIQATSDLRTEH